MENNPRNAHAGRRKVAAAQGGPAAAYSKKARLVCMIPVGPRPLRSGTSTFLHIDFFHLLLVVALICGPSKPSGCGLWPAGDLQVHGIPVINSTQRHLTAFWF